MRTYDYQSNVTRLSLDQLCAVGGFIGHPPIKLQALDSLKSSRMLGYDASVQ